MTIANFSGLPEVQPEEMVVNCAGDTTADDAPNGGPKYDDVPPEEPSFEEQKNIIRDATRAPLATGDIWYLLDIRWYKQWKKFIEFACNDRGTESEHPGPIDNSPLFSVGTSKLKEHLLEGSDYKLINETGWKGAVAWYGVIGEQTPVKRNVVEQGIYNKQLRVEVYLIELKLSLFTDLERVSVKEFSKCTTIGEVVEEMKMMFSVSSEEEVRVWNKFMTNTYELIAKMDQTLQDSGIGSGQMLVLEQKNEDGKWPRSRFERQRTCSASSGMSVASPEAESSAGPSNNLNSSITNSTAATSFSPFSTTNGYGGTSGGATGGATGGGGGRQRVSSIKPGLCGLGNIGNTCFMNSALQCLSNTQPLMKYFNTNTYKHDINTTNPLGMHGKIAEAFAELLHQLWNGQNHFVIPRAFKMQVGRFAPQFSGYQQQDSHELLAFLLDGLHEDLNRVKQKPYIEMKDDMGRPDEVVASEAWTNHSRRNSSIIVDYFHGQFKSTVECPECKKRSVTFDPFCYLSLPLPVKKERTLQITLVPLDPSKRPMKVKVTVPKMGTTRDLVQSTAKLTGTDPEKLVVTDVFTSKFHKRYDLRENVSHITDRDDIFIYEVPVEVSNADDQELLVLPIYHREIRTNAYSSSYSYSSNSYSSNTLFGRPMLVPVPKANTTTADLYNIILRWMRRFVVVNNEAVTSVDTDNDENDDTKDSTGDAEMAEADAECGDDLDELKIKDDEKIKEDEEKEIAPEKKGVATPAVPSILFEIKLVNSNGTTDIQSLQYDDQSPLKLTSRSHLALDWYPKCKESYYNEKLAEETEDHESLQSVHQAKKNIQLNDCLELFLQKEKLGADDPWYCPDCKEHRQAFKKFDLWTLPKVLVIHLKRFSYNRYMRDKLDVLVNFPLQALDLTSYVINKKHPRAVYDLHAVSNHYGGLGGGHYTAYATNCNDDSWYYFDDSSVSAADANAAVSKAAYVLFYTRRDDPETRTRMMSTSEIPTDVFQNSDDDDDIEDDAMEPAN